MSSRRPLSRRARSQQATSIRRRDRRAGAAIRLVACLCTLASVSSACSSRPADGPDKTSEPTSSSGAIAADVRPRPIAQDAQQLVDGTRARYGARGSLGVVNIDGVRTRFAVGVADGDGTPVDVNMRFRIGSITKTITAALVLDQVAQGRVRLDDNVFDLLGPPLRSDPAVTVGSLLDHTSGIFDIGNEGDPMADLVLLTDPGLLAEVDDLFARAAEGHSIVASARLIVALAETHDRAFAPGAQFSYSNTNYQLAGMVVEAVAGQTLAAVLADRIVTPLELGSTSLAPDDVSSPEFRGFAVEIDTGQEIDATDDLLAFGNGGNGGVISTADDLLDMLTAIVHGPLLPPAIRNQMLTATDQSNDTYGLGIGAYELSCGMFWGHEGRVNGTVTLALVAEATPDNGVVVAMNKTAGDPELLELADGWLCQTTP